MASNMDISTSDEEIDCIEEEDEGGVFKLPPGPIQPYRFEPDATSDEDEEDEDEEEEEERRSGGEEQEEIDRLQHKEWSVLSAIITF
jgi:hypothetical protein